MPLKIVAAQAYLPSRSTGHFSRITLPYLMKTIGIGMNAKAKNPSNELPHPTPRLPNIFGPARGSRAPTKERVAVKVALADAAYLG